MTECTNEIDIYQTAAHNMGNGFGETGPWQTRPEVREFFEEYNMIMDRDNLETVLETAAMSSTPTAEYATSGDARSAHAVAKSVVSLEDRTVQGQANRIADAEKALNEVNGLSTGDVGLWYNMINKMNTWLVDARATFDKWVMRWAQDPKLQPFMQPLIRQKNQLYSNIAGIQNVYSKRRQALLDDLIPIEKKTGISTEKIALDWGMVADAEHAPEANARLIMDWTEEWKGLKDEYAYRQSKGLDPETDARMAELDNQITKTAAKIINLNNNLNSTKRPPDLISCGFTNAEARLVKESMLKKYGVDEATMDAWTQKLRDEIQFLHGERADNGTLTPDQLASFPEFQKYVPLYSPAQNLDGAVNNASVFNPGSYHARRGMTADMIPDSAWNSLVFYGNRTAMEVGMKDFSLSLGQLARKLKLEGHGDRIRGSRDIQTMLAGGKKEGQTEPTEYAGLRSASYKELLAWTRGARGPEYQRKAEKILNYGGIIADMPAKDKSGKDILERRYIYFDEAYSKDGVTGQMLNDALSSHYRSGSKFVDTLGTLSGYHGQLYTRFSPFFAPVGGFRDYMERVFHMVNRTYYTDDGQTIKGHNIIGSYLKNTPRTARMLFDAMVGRAEEGSQAAQYWDEFQRHGVFQKFIPPAKRSAYSLEQSFAPRENSADAIMKRLGIDANMEKYLNTLGRGKDIVLRKLDGWNDYLQNMGSFNQYVTLREKGLSPARAARDTLELIDMRQHGTLTPYMRMIAPFVVPTMQSAAAMGRTLGFGARNAGDIFKQGMNGWLGVMGGMMAFGALYQVAREAMGYDENGKSWFDSIPLREAVGFIPVPTDDNDGSYFKIPNGFGPMRLSAAMAIGTDRLSRGLMEPEDFAVDLMLTVAKDVVPTTFPQYKFTSKPAEFISQMITPDVVKPFIELATNTNYFGSEIYNARRGDKARSDSGRTSTDVFWHNTARWFNRNYGLDAAPEQYQYLLKSYSAGPVKLAMAALNSTFSLTDPDYPRKGQTRPSAADEMGPWVQALGGSMFYGKVRNNSQTMYFDYKRAVEDKIKRYGIKISAKENMGKPEEARAFRENALRESGQFTPEEIADYELMRQTDQRLVKLSSDFNTNFKESWMNMENAEQVRQELTNFDTAANEDYNNFINNSYFYRDR